MPRGNPTPIVLLPDTTPSRSAAMDDGVPAAPPPRPEPDRVVASSLVRPVSVAGLTDPNLHVRLSPARLGSPRGALTFTPPAWEFIMSPDPYARWDWVRPGGDDADWPAMSGNQDVSVIIDLKKLSSGTAYLVEIAVLARARPSGFEDVWPASPRYLIEQSETNVSREWVHPDDQTEMRTLEAGFTATHETKRLRLLLEGVYWLALYEVVVRRA